MPKEGAEGDRGMQVNMVFSTWRLCEENTRATTQRIENALQTITTFLWLGYNHEVTVG